MLFVADEHCEIENVQSFSNYNIEQNYSGRNEPDETEKSFPSHNDKQSFLSENIEDFQANSDVITCHYYVSNTLAAKQIFKNEGKEDSKMSQSQAKESIFPR